MPVYRIVAKDVEGRIKSGSLQPGHAVPSETDLMREHGVARITARLAIKYLREQGLIYTIQGVGSFVMPEDAPRVSRKALLYRDIAKALIERIKADELHPDMPIPSETTLMQEHGVARGTVREAVKYLRELGWVYTVPQRGTYVKKREDWPAGE